MPITRLTADERDRLARAFDRQRNKDKHRSRDNRVRVNRNGANYLIVVSTSVVEPLVDNGLVNMRYTPEITDEGILFRPVGEDR